MKFACLKVRESGNNRLAVTERGSFFGYGDLVVDMRGIPIMKKECECPVIMDITHSLQQPNGADGVSGGLPGLISTIAKSGLAAGADGIFMETHRNPAIAKSDGANMLPLSEAAFLLKNLTTLRSAINEINL